MFQKINFVIQYVKDISISNVFLTTKDQITDKNIDIGIFSIDDIQNHAQLKTSGI